MQSRVDNQGQGSTETRERWYHRLGRGAPLAVIIAAVLFIAYQLLFVLELIAIAALIAVLVRALTDGLGRLGIRPGVSAVIIVAVLGLIIAGFWLLLFPRIIQEVQQLLSAGPSGTLSQAQQNADARSGIFGFIPDVSSLIEQLRGYLTQNLSSRLPSLARELFTVGLDVIAALFLALFLSLRPEAKIRGLMRLVPPEKQEGFRDFLDDLNWRLRGWLVGAGVAMLFVGVSASLGLWFIGVPLAFTFGIIAGLLNVVPFLGSILGALLPALVALVTDPISAVYVLILFLVINQIDGNVIQPLVMGSQAEIPPVLILASFLIAAGFLGPAGLLLAVPAVILLMTIMNWKASYKTGDEESVEDEEDSGSSEGWVQRLTQRLKSNGG